MKNDEQAVMSELQNGLSNGVKTKVKALVTAPLVLDDATRLREWILGVQGLIQENQSIAPSFAGIQFFSKADLDAMVLAELKSLAISLRTMLENFAEDELIFVTNTPNTDLVSELNNIDFSKLIGGPLQAAVDAQSAASIASINFIKEVGFEKDEAGNPTGVRYVDFVYDEKTGEFDENNNEKVITKKVRVPLLSMLTVPSLRIETLDIDFNVKLNSVESRDIKSQFGIKASGSAGWGPVKFKVSSSYQRSSSSGVKVQKQYTMNVKVKATQDEIPLGLEKVLNLLSN